MASKSVYQKLAEVRVEIQNLNLKKTGKNNHSGFTYYELSDIVPAINAQCAKFGILPRFSIVGKGDDEKAVLDLYDTSEPHHKISFVIPTEEVEIGKRRDGTGGAEPIQNLGGKTTYLRRYLHLIAFEIVEPDTIETRAPQQLVMDQKDIDSITNTKTVEDLTKVCSLLRTRYPVALITPYFNAHKEALSVIKVEK